MGLNSAEYRSSEAVKTWMDGSERRFDTFTIGEYDDYSDRLLNFDLSQLETTLKYEGVEKAMNQAEHMAVDGGYLDPHRADRRVFLEDDAPPDPFTTERERAMEREMQHDEEKQDPEYSVDAIAANGAARLDVLKSWGDEEHERERLLIPPTRLGDSAGECRNCSRPAGKRQCAGSDDAGRTDRYRSGCD